MNLARKTVLISEPQAHANEPYLPYMWAVLKTHWEDAEPGDDRIDWLEPIFAKKAPDVLLDPHRDAVPDVLGLSCYVWNWDLQCEIAKRVKARNPRCLVVAGGPHPDYKDPDFFRRHPHIDLVAVKDGEVTFNRILNKVLVGDDDFRDVAGLYLPGPDGPVGTGGAEVPSGFDHSPYLAQNAYFEKLRARHGSARLDAIWETNRGCPYSCSFCDWGSNTMSKVRRFDMDRLELEIEWLAHMQIWAILLTDANFGMLKRDTEIADLLNEARTTWGSPRFVHYSPAKNNPDRTVEIAVKFASTGISPVYPLAIQHTDPRVLAATERSNISVEKQREVVRTVASLKIPTLVQLILGIPGDSYERWKTCLTDLMDWGLHDNCQVFDYALLPNAPAAERSFRERWEIQTIRRWLPKMGFGQRRKDDWDALDKLEIVVASKTFSRSDWVRMKTYAAFVRALHHIGPTRLISMYLHFSHGVSYRDFYDRVIEGYFGRSEPYRKLMSHFQAFLEDEDVVQDLELEQFPEHPMCFAPGQWLFVQLCWNFEAYFDGLEAFLLEQFPEAVHLGSALDFQRSLVILPGYDRNVGKCIPTDFDWIRYFEKARTITSSSETLAEPEATPGAAVDVSDAGDELNWSDLDGEERWLRWIELTQEMGRTFNTLFRELKLRVSP